MKYGMTVIAFLLWVIAERALLLIFRPTKTLLLKVQYRKDGGKLALRELTRHWDPSPSRSKRSKVQTPSSEPGFTSMEITSGETAQPRLDV